MFPLTSGSQACHRLHFRFPPAHFRSPSTGLSARFRLRGLPHLQFRFPPAHFRSPSRGISARFLFCFYFRGRRPPPGPSFIGRPDALPVQPPNFRVRATLFPFPAKIRQPPPAPNFRVRGYPSPPLPYAKPLPEGSISGGASGSLHYPLPAQRRVSGLLPVWPPRFRLLPVSGPRPRFRPRLSRYRK